MRLVARLGGLLVESREPPLGRSHHRGRRALAITAMLLVRRRAPVGSYFEDGDRAACTEQAAFPKWLDQLLRPRECAVRADPRRRSWAESSQFLAASGMVLLLQVILHPGKGPCNGQRRALTRLAERTLGRGLRLPDGNYTDWADREFKIPPSPPPQPKVAWAMTLTIPPFPPATLGHRGPVRCLWALGARVEETQTCE